MTAGCNYATPRPNVTTVRQNNFAAAHETVSIFRSPRAAYRAGSRITAEFWPRDRIHMGINYDVVLTLQIDKSGQCGSRGAVQKTHTSLAIRRKQSLLVGDEPRFDIFSRMRYKLRKGAVGNAKDSRSRENFYSLPVLRSSSVREDRNEPSRARLIIRLVNFSKCSLAWGNTERHFRYAYLKRKKGKETYIILGRLVCRRGASRRTVFQVSS